MSKDKILIKEKISLAIIEHKKGNINEAEKRYKIILSEDSNNFDVIFLLGTLYAQIKKYDLSKDLLIKAIKIKSYHADSHNNLGNVYKELGNYIEANRSYKRALNIDPKNINFLIFILALNNKMNSIFCFENVN